MNYPNSINAVREAMLNYAPTEPNPAFSEALEKPAEVSRIVGTFNALKDVENLDDEGRKLLCGIAALIAKHKWHGQADAALAVYAATLPTLPAEPAV